jgi:hypothetical protein
LLDSGLFLDLFGNVAQRAESALIRRYAGENLAVREGLSRKLASLRSELAGPTPAPLERLLVERVAACWLHLYDLEASYAGKDSMPLEVAAYYQRSIDRAHKRYLSAIKTLALVRKLALPVLVKVSAVGRRGNGGGNRLPVALNGRHEGNGGPE